MPYETYKSIDFKVPFSSFSDCFDRYLLRIEEMRESLVIIHQAISKISNKLVSKDSFKIGPPTRKLMKTSMEALIQHFKFYSEGFLVTKGEVFLGVEAPKGEFGIYIVSNNTGIPYRCRVKAPGFVHLQAITYLSKCNLIADVVTIIGTLDIVFGEVDR